MWGAIIGDLAGSIYEYNQRKEVTSITNVKELITNDSFYSDDTILTVAIIDAILNDNQFEKYIKLYTNQFLDYRPNTSPYFKTAFSPNFIRWVKSNEIGHSIGNGAMMRISPIGYLYNNEQDIIDYAKLATIPSHNTDEAINSATLVAQIIFLARNGFNKEDIIKKLSLTIEKVPFEKFNTTCGKTIGNCLYAVFTSNNFEESIRSILSFGGDTDTNACIVGSMAEALYSIDQTLIDKAKTKLPIQFINKVEQAYNLNKNFNISK